MINIKKYLTIKWLLPFFTILIYLSFSFYKEYTNNYIDSSLKKSLIIYASLKSLNSGISIIKDSSIKVGVGVEGNLAIGNIVSPIYDSIERFSDLLTISIWIFGVEKFIYEMSNFKFFYIVIFILSILFFFKQNEFLKRILLLLIFFRLFMPISALMSSYIDKKVFLPKIDKYLKVIEHVNKKNNIMSKIAHTDINIKQNQNFIDSMKSKFSKISNQFVYIKKSLTYYINNFVIILDSLFYLSLLYFSQFFIEVILFPIVMFFLIKQLF